MFSTCINILSLIVFQCLPFMSCLAAIACFQVSINVARMDYGKPRGRPPKIKSSLPKPAVSVTIERHRHRSTSRHRSRSPSVRRNVSPTPVNTATTLVKGIFQPFAKRHTLERFTRSGLCYFRTKY